MAARSWRQKTRERRDELSRDIYEIGTKIATLVAERLERVTLTPRPLYNSKGIFEIWNLNMTFRNLKSKIDAIDDVL